jgi:hypothetical protein
MAGYSQWGQGQKQALGSYGIGVTSLPPPLVACIVDESEQQA